MRSCRRSYGFTLLEVLIALAVFSLIGVGAFTLLASLLNTGEMAGQRAAQLKDVQLTINLLRQDFFQLESVVATAEGTVAVDGQDGPSRVLLNITRVQNPAFGGAGLPTLTEVIYALETGSQSKQFDLVRYSRESLDDSQLLNARDGATDFRRQVLSTGITDSTIRFQDSAGAWLQSWEMPPAKAGIAEEEEEEEEEKEPGEERAEGEKARYPLPTAVEIVFVHRDQGDIILQVETPAGLPGR